MANIGQNGPDSGSPASSPDPASIFQAPAITTPQGGGAVRGIGEKFDVNPVTGTASLNIPLPVSTGRSGFSPQLDLHYDSGGGNGTFGFGWNLSLPSVTRKTNKGLPLYNDADESDVFILSGTEDLVPISPAEPIPGTDFIIRVYRPRIEGLFARIERWTNLRTGHIHWRSISGDNITTLYGRTLESCIADPHNPQRIFSWLICESFDDKGNAIHYTYKPEDSTGVDVNAPQERNRTPQTRAANCYIKRIYYGNLTPHHPDEDLTVRDDWLFEVVFDYGEHGKTTRFDMPENVILVEPAEELQPWHTRADVFSSYRAGFEVRTYRRCQRILMVHHFEEELGAANTVVRTTTLTYRESKVASFIEHVVNSGLVRKRDTAYLQRSMPALSLTYSEVELDDTVHEVDAASLENLPYGLDNVRYQWVDLDGEGVPGILTEQNGGWYYKRNWSPFTRTHVHFGPAELVRQLPSFNRLNQQTRLMDLDGDGKLDLVQFIPPTPGYFERNQVHGEDTWTNFKPFEAMPNLNWDDPNLRMIDLTGDGHADVLITEDHVFTWHPSFAEAGFGQAERVYIPLYEDESGPHLIFADGTQSIYLADMSGGGLVDLVRVKNGEVCYWSNLGYGHFSAKVTMDNAPWFDLPNLFDQRRVRLADIDGSGTTDIIYLHNEGVHLYFNQCGNTWSDARILPAFPRVDNLAAVQVVDLFGKGTACLVWSSTLPADSNRPMSYIDLMGRQKPHLLLGIWNNLGAETHIHYSTSTHFYLEDRFADHPWITRLSFPVHVVEHVEVFDHISRSRFSSRYAYHHGFYDGVEREFRGFGMVERLDTEFFESFDKHDSVTNIDQASHLPPVMTRTWFHTGAFENQVSISCQMAHEYYGVPRLSAAEFPTLWVTFASSLLPDTILPEDLTTQELREACRALKGSLLRQEVFALDGSAREGVPYSISEHNYTVKVLQTRGENYHAVFYVHPRETVVEHLERSPDDPRTTHQMVLRVDDFGNVEREVAIAYARREMPERQPEQAEIHVSLSLNRFTNLSYLPNGYRIGMPIEQRIYEVVNPPVTGTRFSFDELSTLVEALIPVDQYEPAPQNTLPYEQWDWRRGGISGMGLRLLEHTRSYYRSNDLSRALPLGEVEALAIPFESCQLAFTTALLFSIYGERVADEMLADGGYVHLEGDDNWWIPSGHIYFTPDEVSAEQENAEARAHFYMPRRFTNPFGDSSIVHYDAYDLLLVETHDALGSITLAQQDYRVLQPIQITSPNQNQTLLAYDAFSMVAGTAVMGKKGENLGDSLDAFRADLTQAEVQAFFADPLKMAVRFLGSATTRIIYDLHRYTRERQPACAASLNRETHLHQLADDQTSKVQVTVSYSDGFGREIQKKIQAEPGHITSDSGIIEPRWVGSGWTVFNNKGNPVRQYEPFFSATHEFELAHIVGVSPILFYDPLERVIATLFPDHTWSKVTFDSWQQTTWDANDTVLIDPVLDPDVSDYFARLPEKEYRPTWYEQHQGDDAAAKTTLHADTPSTAYLDTLGRTVLMTAHNRFERDETLVDEYYTSHVVMDIENNQREIFDAHQRLVMRYDFSLHGVQVHQASMEAGESWMLNDVTGHVIYSWDSRGHRFRTVYDSMRRPVEVYRSINDEPEILVSRTIYGESRDEPEAHNLRGQTYQVYDKAGIITTDKYDFKGNLLHSQRQLAAEYHYTFDWSADVPLENDLYESYTTFDALSRPLAIHPPDGSVIRPAYNEANLLEQLYVTGRESEEETIFVENIDYTAKGQRERITYGNGITTDYEYDPLTFRLTRLSSRRNSGAALQDLTYTYDPVGNITHIYDAAQQDTFFRNQRVTPDGDYTYDALYRLVKATGREHLGQNGAENQLAPPTPTSPSDKARTGILAPGDGHAMGRYNEHYQYDAVGNILAMIHRGSDPAHPGWTRRYTYEEDSQLQPAHNNNRLSSTQVGNGDTEAHQYDAHGNMIAMPHLPFMRWDCSNQLTATAQQVVSSGTPETTYYVYDAGGQRVRKVTDRHAAKDANPIRKTERIYLGGFEIYREFDGSGQEVTLERETLHIMDDKQRIALIETRTIGEDDAPQQLTRFQHSNHLGSAVLELDADAKIISYEEYYPFGSTAFQAVRSQTETPKRYRYTGKERDTENSLYYHGARYYAPWLGRWTSADPAGLVDGSNLYAYVRNNPVSNTDSTGTQCDPTMQSCIDPTVQASEDKTFTSSSESSSSSSSSSLASTFMRSVAISPAPVSSAPVQMANSFDDLLTFLHAQAGFETGAVRPPTFNPRSASPFGTAAHARSTGVLAEMQNLGFLGSESIYSEVRVVNGVVTQIGGTPGGPAGAHNLDIVVARPGATISLGDDISGGVAASIGDLKYGGGVIDPKYATHGSPLTTITGRTTAGPIPMLPEPMMTPSARWVSGGLGTLNVGGGALMLASVDTERDPGVITAAKITSGSASVIGGGLEIYGAWAMAAGAVETGAALSGVGLIVAAPIMVYEMRPRGWIAHDPELRERAMQRYRNGENVNAFCAQCHGPGGALDPNNDWNSRDPARRAAFARRLQWHYLGD